MDDPASRTKLADSKITTKTNPAKIEASWNSNAVGIKTCFDNERLDENQASCCNSFARDGLTLMTQNRLNNA
jgi:hypothetical protein